MTYVKVPTSSGNAHHPRCPMSNPPVGFFGGCICGSLAQIVLDIHADMPLLRNDNDDLRREGMERAIRVILGEA